MPPITPGSLSCSAGRPVVAYYMDAYTLRYNAAYQVIICILHGAALPPPSIKSHLWRQHAAKGIQLQDALQEIETYVLVRPEAVRPPAACIAPIEGLAINQYYRCTLPHREADSTACSKRKQTVERHLSKVHAIGPRKTIKPKPHMIQEVSMQSFFGGQHSKLFEVLDSTCMQASSIISPISTVQDPILGGHTQSIAYQPILPGPMTGPLIQPQHTSPNHTQESAIQAIASSYQDSQRSWQTQFEVFREGPLHASQTPPWLSLSGIAPFITRLHITKGEVFATGSVACNDLDASVKAVIQDLTLYRLRVLSKTARPGLRDNCIDRVTARLLNSFEPNRVQSRPFHAVQTEGSLHTYSMAWSGIIIMLLSLLEKPESHSLRQACMQAGSKVALLTHAVKKTIQRLSQALTKHKPAYSTLEALDQANNVDASIYNSAREALRACDKLSTTLTTQQYSRNVFTLPVVCYAACRALTKGGSWLPASDYRPLTSALIHCMQLWFLGSCLYDWKREKAQFRMDSSLSIYVQERCQQHLINTTPGPIAELSYWRLLSKTASNDVVSLPTTTVSPDCMQVSHANIDLSITAWQHALRNIYGKAKGLLFDELFFGIADITRYCSTNLYDNASEATPAWSFLNDPRNVLHAELDYLQRRSVSDIRVQRLFLGLHATDSPQEINRVRCNGPRVGTYFAHHETFLQLLAVLIYMTAGLPPRRKELLSIAWCNQEVARNLYIYHGQVALITGYHKTQWRIGTRPIARILPHAVGDLVVMYLIYIPRWLNFLFHCMQRTELQGFLFANGQGLWSPDHLSRIVKETLNAELGFPMSTRQWRHIAIAIDRRLMQGIGCQTYGVAETKGLHPENESGSDDNESFLNQNNPRGIAMLNGVHAMQASHTLSTNIIRYGNSFHAFNGMTDTLLAAFHDVSIEWHKQADCSAFQPACIQPGVATDVDVCTSSTEPRAGSRLEVRQKLWTWKAILDALKQLLGLHADFKSDSQRDAIRLIVRSLPEAIIVMPTGSGKTLLYILPSLLPNAQVTVVVIPLVALRHDLLRRCKEWGISPLMFTANHTWDNRLHAVPQLVFVDVENAIQPPFQTLLLALNRAGRLDRIVIDEAHLIVTAAHYRDCMGQLSSLRRAKCPMICLSGTLPPFACSELRTALHMYSAVILRSPSNRPNLIYQIKQLHARYEKDAPKLYGQELLLQETIALYHAARKQWAERRMVSARSVCFVRSRRIGELLAKRLGCLFYHGLLEVNEKDRIATAWSKGDATPPILVATSAFGAGVDYPAIRQIIHVDAPTGMLEYAQETGRAGRDGLHATCYTLLSPNWNVAWDVENSSYALDRNRSSLTTYLLLQASCHRLYLTAFLDGDVGYAVSCMDVANGTAYDTLCSNCLSKDDLGAGSPTSTPSEYSFNVPTRANSALHATQSSTCDTLDSGLHATGTTVQAITNEAEATECSSSTTDTAYNFALHYERLDAIQNQQAKAIYQQRVMKWQEACIFCSLLHSKATSRDHTDCMQTEMFTLVYQLQKSIVFEPRSGCYRCGQPLWICFDRRQACPYPTIIFECLIAVFCQNRLHAKQLIDILGGPNITDGSKEQYQKYLKWVGKQSTLFGKSNSSIASKVTHHWLDRLDGMVCEAERNN